MIKLGEIQDLEVVKKMDFGVYLKSADDERGDNRILLPIKQVPVNTEIGDKITVFVYRDSNDRIIATVNKPKIVIGEIGFLKVVEMSKIGAFLNWGLEKDLFLPFKEQIGELRNSGEYMVGLYVDKSDRLCATMNLFKVLRTDSPYNINDVVKGTVFSLKRGLGAMIAVEGKYLGLIHEGEILKPLRSGDEVEVRVSNIKEDGKLDLSLKDAPKLQIDRDGDKIFNALAKNKGYLPLNDNSDPKLIIDMLSMSKSSFKKGVGRLMKKGMIEITKEGIKLAEKKERPASNYDYDDNRNKSNHRHNNSNGRNYGNNNNRSNNNYRSDSNNKKGSDYRNNSDNKSNYKGNNDNKSNSFGRNSSSDNRNNNSDSKSYNNYKGNNDNKSNSFGRNNSSDNRNNNSDNKSYNNYKGNNDNKSNSFGRNSSSDNRNKNSDSKSYNNYKGNNDNKSNSSGRNNKGNKDFKGTNSDKYKK